LQTDYAENIHKRIQSELKKLGISMAEAARRIGESDSQGLRDVCAGRKRASAELIAKLMLIEGINIRYILTGEDMLNKEKSYDNSVCILTIEEMAILSSYRLASETGKRVIAAACSILAEEKKHETKQK
jgi:transcriptional regulator with XRE-family HTH domain